MKNYVTTKFTFRFFTLLLAVFCVFGRGAPTAQAEIYIQRNGIGTTHTNTDTSHALRGIMFFNSNRTANINGSTDLSGNVWFTATEGTTYYVTTPLPLSNTCEDERVLFHYQYSIGSFATLADGTGETVNGLCQFELTAYTSLSNYDVVMISIINNNDNLNIAVTGDNSGSFSTYDYYQGTFEKHGTPKFTVSSYSITDPYVTINTPNNGKVVQDFTNWNISWGGLTNDMKQLGIHYSDDLSILEDCEEFPWGGGAGYTECINGSPRIWTDYGISTSITGSTTNINKDRPLTLGTTYYAQAVIQEEDSFGTNIVVSDIISFTIGIEGGDTGGITECSDFDIICYIKNGVTWLFVPSTQSLYNFKTLTLENTLPFSYIYDTGTLYEELFDQDPEDINISIPFLGHTFVLLSTDMLQAVAFQSLVRTILGAILIFSTALFVYRKIMGIHDAGHQTVK